MVAGVGEALLGATALGALLAGVVRGLRRYATVDEVSFAMFRAQRRLRGIVVAVPDGDGFRMQHTPWLRSFQSIRRGELAKTTLSIRLAGIDAPEMPHFGHPGQPLAEESRDVLVRLILGKKVTIKLHQRDQYKRAVCTVHVRKHWWRPAINVSVAMVESGFAVMYDREGGEFGNMLGRLEAAEADAKRKRLGVWSLKSFESPMDYKKRLRGFTTT